MGGGAGVHVEAKAEAGDVDEQVGLRKVVEDVGLRLVGEDEEAREGHCQARDERCCRRDVSDLGESVCRRTNPNQQVC
jgi:hypothetical protein